MDKNIFTFWEPAGAVFPYLELCVETWKKFYPEYTIHHISYNNLFEYIDENTYNFSELKKFSLPMQADAIRAALLYKYGGIWMDHDTIISSEDFFTVFDCSAECSMFGAKQLRSPHIGIIRAEKHAELMKHWMENVSTRLTDKELLKTRDWSYLGNAIITPYSRQLDKSKFQYIPREDTYLVIEGNFINEKKYRLTAPENYRYFWFENNFVEYIRHTPACKGVYLHNSWTPQFIKECSHDEFVNIDCTLSDFICGILGINNSKVYYYNFMQNKFINSKDIDESDIIDINCSGNRYKMYLPDKNDADQRLVRLPKRPREVEVLYEMKKALGGGGGTIPPTEFYWISAIIAAITVPTSRLSVLKFMLLNPTSTFQEFCRKRLR